jgi:S-layer family protein
MRSILLGLATAAAVTVAFATVAPAQTFPPVGPELAISVPAPADVFDPAIAAIADRGYVVVWRAGTNIIGRRFDAAGTALGAEFTANVLPASAAAPAVGARSDGGFLVAWQAPDGSGDGIFARRFDAAGLPVGGEIVVNPTATGGQTNPRVAGVAHGYVVAWARGGSGIRLLDASGTPGTTVSLLSDVADVAASGTGFVAAMVDFSDPSLIRAQLYDAAGNLRGSVTVASGFSPPLGLGGVPPPMMYRMLPRVASAADGTFTVCWSTIYVYYDPSPPIISHTIDYGTSIRRYNGAGLPLGPARNVQDFGPGFQDEGAVAASPSGRLFTAWASRPQEGGCTGCPPTQPQDGSGSGIYGRVFDPAGNDISGEIRVNTTTSGDQSHPAVAASGESSALVVWQGAQNRGIFGQRFGYFIAPARFEVDITASATANGNGVLEPGERAVVASAWRNISGYAQPLTAYAVLGGGPGPVYETPDNFADFGIVANGAIGSCRDTGNCFAVRISGARPAPHWDAGFAEQIVPVNLLPWRTRTMHVGDSFADVVRSSPFTRFVETVYHYGVMDGCAPGSFCPLAAVTREQMAPSVVRASDPAFVPRACVAGGELFADVPASNPNCPWIEELARRNVVTGCGGGNYCPTQAVSREQLPVYLLATRDGSGYAPPACGTPVFLDVPASSPFCPWVEELVRRHVVAGCGNGNYCPAPAVTREQMSVFLAVTFELSLYVP